MVTITNRAPLSHVFQVKDGNKVMSKSLPPGATDTFDLAHDPDPLVDLLAKAGDIIVKPDTPSKPAPSTPNPPTSQAGPA
jgi:hypothetical protein